MAVVLVLSQSDGVRVLPGQVGHLDVDFLFKNVVTI
jgi:hypothetical protein